MKVYYNPSLWAKGKGFCGLPQRVNWEFEYEETKRWIPVIYRFPKGIVFDIITFLDEEKLHDFFEKYEDIEEKLTPFERRLAEQEHPYQSMFIKKMHINGKPIDTFSSSSAVSMPWAKQDDNLKHIRKAYFPYLKETSSFACEHYCVPYPETNSKTQKLLRFLRLYKINSLKLETHSLHMFYPLDIHFEMSVREDQKLITFKHPLTGISHKLYFQSLKPMEIPINVTGTNNKLYAANLMYEIEPALSSGDKLQFNSSTQYIEPPVDRFAPQSASSIGIIGGADGPTTIFYTSRKDGNNVPLGHHGLQLHNCFSVPSLNKYSSFRFVLEGLNIKKSDGVEYYFND
jgi:hypothetical protein